MDEAWDDEESHRRDHPTLPQNKERKRKKKKKKKRKRSKEKARWKQDNKQVVSPVAKVMPEPPTPTADTQMPLDHVGLSTPVASSLASFEGTTIHHGQEMSRMSVSVFGGHQHNRVQSTAHHERVES